MSSGGCDKEVRRGPDRKEPTTSRKEHCAAPKSAGRTFFSGQPAHHAGLKSPTMRTRLKYAGREKRARFFFFKVMPGRVNCLHRVHTVGGVALGHSARPKLRVF